MESIWYILFVKVSEHEWGLVNGNMFRPIWMQARGLFRKESLRLRRANCGEDNLIRSSKHSICRASWELRVEISALLHSLACWWWKFEWKEKETVQEFSWRSHCISNIRWDADEKPEHSCLIAEFADRGRYFEGIRGVFWLTYTKRSRNALA